MVALRIIYWKDAAGKLHVCFTEELNAPLSAFIPAGGVVVDEDFDKFQLPDRAPLLFLVPRLKGL
jgi:hypothetical protein